MKHRFIGFHPNIQNAQKCVTPKPKTKSTKKIPAQASLGQLNVDIQQFSPSVHLHLLGCIKDTIPAEVLFSLVDDLIDGGFLVTRSCHNVFVIC